jgi:ubiquinone/menaquinone biosynthesis C-methylase UbiE
MSKDYTNIERQTKKIYIEQHKNYQKDPSIFDRHLESSESLESYDLPADFFSGISVLDAGCGNAGYFQVAMRNLGVSKVACMDIGDDWIPELKSVLSSHGVPEDFSEYMPGSTTEIPFPENSFDFVASNGVLMHLDGKEQAAQALKELTRVTKPGGFVFAHIGIDSPGIVDRYIVPSLRAAYAEDLEFREFIDNADPAQIVDALKNIYGNVAQHDESLAVVSQELEHLITLDTTTFWQNMIQVPVQQGPLLSEEWGKGTMEKCGLMDVRRPQGIYWKRNDFRKYLAPIHYSLKDPIAKLFYGNGHVKLIGQKKV